MIILTTISPTNTDNQLRAVETWKYYGHDVYSLNSKSDIRKLKDTYPVTFIETDKLGTEYGKDYVRINAFMDWVKDNGSALVINSDVEIHGTITHDEDKKTLWIYQRNDYLLTPKVSRLFQSGFDAFYIAKDFAEKYPQSKLVVGQCHWDYAIPLFAVRNGYRLKMPRHTNLFHKKHALQYNTEKWKATAKVFANEFKMSGIPHNDSMSAYRTITTSIKYV